MVYFGEELMVKELVLKCMYRRLSKVLGYKGFIGVILGDRRELFKIMLTFRSDVPGGRVAELHVVLDRYLELKPYSLTCIVGYYTNCILKRQEDLFKEISQYIVLDKYLVGRNEVAWLIYDIASHQLIVDADLWNDEVLVNRCQFIDPSYVVGLRNYLLAHHVSLGELLNKVKNITVRVEAHEY